MKNVIVSTLLLLGLLYMPEVWSATMINTSGTVQSLRTSSKYHESIPANEETETIFKLDTAFTDCEWVGVKNSDSGFVSILLSAQAQGKSVRIWYYKDKHSPVWSSVCQAATIEIK